jgi:hypothetical protein
MDDTSRSGPTEGGTTGSTGWPEPLTSKPVAVPGAVPAEEGGRTATAREWMGQLQAMIDNLTTHAAPVMREIGAKAAELAAVAGEKAGPIAARAAEVTAQAGSKVAERGREVAAELRRDAGKEANGNGSGTPQPTPVGAGTATRSDTAESVGE